MEVPNEAWIIVYIWNSPSEWIGSFPSTLPQQMVTQTVGKLPMHFDSFKDAATYIKNNSLVDCIIVPVAGETAIKWSKQQKLYTS